MTVVNRTISVCAGGTVDVSGIAQVTPWCHAALTCTLQGDMVQHVVSGRTLVVFLVRGPLILVATSRLGEPLTALAAQLRLLHRQIQVIVTTGAAIGR